MVTTNRSLLLLSVSAATLLSASAFLPAGPPQAQFRHRVDAHISNSGRQAESRSNGPFWRPAGRRPGRGSTAEDQEGLWEVTGQSVEDGVSLLALGDVQEDAAWLEDTIAKWLDDEWIPQDIHRDLGRKSRELYVKAREEGVTDLGQLLLTVGSELEEMDMGDAFVDAWSVANKVSDLLLSRMGREVCCSPVELTQEQEAMMDGVKEPAAAVQAKGGPQLLVPEMPPYFFGMEEVLEATERYLDEFNRFDFIRKFLEGQDDMWKEANLVMAILLGFRYDEWGNVALDGLHERFQHMSLPPDFEGNEELRDKLEGILAEDQDEDKMKSLEEFIEVMVGKGYYHQQLSAKNTDFTCRATLVKWIYEHDFVADFATLDGVRAILDVKSRLDEKNNKDKPPARFYY